MVLTQSVIPSIKINITAGMVDIAMLLVTFISVLCAFRAYKDQRERSKKEAACNLADNYAKILRRFSDINLVFDALGYNEMVKQTFPIEKIHIFNKSEMDNLLNDANVSLADITGKIVNGAPEYFLFYRQTKACSSFAGSQDLSMFLQEDTESGEIIITQEKFLRNDFLQDLSDISNSLESFSMSCRYGIADEELLYQSLHQTFLSSVWSFYPFISQVNQTNEDKYYTNMIWLFNHWQNRLNEIKTKTERKRNEHLQKAQSVEAPIFSGKRL